LLKEATASSIRDFIGEQLKDASEKFAAEQKAKEDAIKDAEEKFASLSSDSENLKKELESLKQSLEALQQEKSSKEKQEVFSSRMAALDEEYDLDTEDREVIANDIRDLDETSFSAYQKKMGVLMKEKNKAYKASKTPKEDTKQVASSEVKETVASTENATVVDDAINNGTQQADQITAGMVNPSKTVKQKYQSAFNDEGFVITK
jgi:chromosome segregation ATPase